VAFADQAGAEGVTWHVAAEAEAEAGSGADGQQDFAGAPGGRAGSRRSG